LQSLADQLGIAIRNAELYSEALHAREVAERANQLKTRLLANVSHELRAPLNVILGYTQSALNIPNPYKSDLPEELLQDLRLIYKSGEHLIRVINDLLDMSRAEIGELDLVIETIDARPFLSEVFNSTSKSMARTAEVEWKLSLPSRLPYIQADPVRLRQILLNLLNNASKFTPSGQIVLGADVEPPYLHIWVEDTGIGVTTEMQERIFEPFGTTGRSTYRREGIGLGLSITRMLVTLHGGSMSLESQAGIGSTFHVYLPLPGLAGPATLNPSKDELPVLLLLSNDDKPPKEIREICHRQGWAIHPLHLGDDPDHILQNIFPVAIAWDIVGASPNEWNLLQRVRSHPQLARMPFILYGLDSETSESVDIGLTNVLLKPIAGSSLLNILDSLRPQTSKFPVLIVDDDPNARALYQRLVVQALPACPVITAEGGAEALAILNQGDPPWLVILDLMMPEVDGFAVLARIRTDPRTHAAPVIVMSGKILTYADVKRLDYYHVVYHTKGVLTNEEAITSLMRSSSDEATLSQPTSVLAKYALAYLHQNYTLPLTRKELAAAVGVSENYLSHIFRLEMGITPWECLNRLRIQKAKELLLNTPETITSVATQVGFDDSGYFSRTFHKITGQSPQAYRKSAS
jgi:AraC-like DNA-binding protein/nitrogen-specific signal transduction histidine kinase